MYWLRRCDQAVSFPLFCAVVHRALMSAGRRAGAGRGLARLHRPQQGARGCRVGQMPFAVEVFYCTQRAARERRDGKRTCCKTLPNHDRRTSDQFFLAPYWMTLPERERQVGSQKGEKFSSVDNTTLALTLALRARRGISLTRDAAAFPSADRPTTTSGVGPFSGINSLSRRPASSGAYGVFGSFGAVLAADALSAVNLQDGRRRTEMAASPPLSAPV